MAHFRATECFKKTGEVQMIKIEFAFNPTFLITEPVADLMTTEDGVTGPTPTWALPDDGTQTAIATQVLVQASVAAGGILKTGSPPRAEVERAAQRILKGLQKGGG